MVKLSNESAIGKVVELLNESAIGKVVELPNGSRAIGKVVFAKRKPRPAGKIIWELSVSAIDCSAKDSQRLFGSFASKSIRLVGSRFGSFVGLLNGCCNQIK